MAKTTQQTTEFSGDTITIFLSTDGKHTVNVTGPIERREELSALAQEVFDPILEKYGKKEYSPKPSVGGSKSSPSGQDAEPFCADCGAEIKGFKAKDGKWVPAAKIANARKQKYGRVLCYNCYQQIESPEVPF